jgi:hypothetical protein
MISLSLCIVLLGAYICYVLVSLARVHCTARALGIPIIVSPFDLFHPSWYLLGGFIRHIVPRLPYRLHRWYTLSTIDWPFHDKGKIHREVGYVFALVCPWGFTIILADPVGPEALFRHRKDFVKGWNYTLFNFFSHNTFSDNGKDWARQRKITAPCFNERLGDVVWEELI